jgi:hypothetical protein
VQRGGRGLVERTPGEGTPPRGCAGRGRGGPSSAVSGRRRWGKLRHVGGGGGHEGAGAPRPGEAGAPPPGQAGWEREPLHRREKEETMKP